MPSTERAASAAADPDFRKLWAAQTVSAFGARITRDGLPIMAVIGLAATPGQLGVLAALSAAPALVLGLAAGGWVDRARRRRVLIGADLARAAVLVTLPVAAWLHLLALWQVYVAAVLVAGASVLFEIADHAYLPSVLSRERITDGNARLAATDSVAEIGGPALAGLLFQWLAAPVAVAVNAITYLVSAAFLATIAKPDPAPDRSGPAPPWTEDVTAGFAAAWRAPSVRPLLLITATHGFFGGIFSALYVVFALQTLGLTPALLGITIAAGGVGALIGAGLTQPLSRAVGPGPALILAAAGVALAVLFIPLAPPRPTLGMASLIAAQVFGDALGVAVLILATSLSQTLLPQSLLGRAAGAFKAVGGGMAVLGALAGGALGQAAGPRAALFVAAAGMSLAAVIALASPLRRTREMPH